MPAKKEIKSLTLSEIKNWFNKRDIPDYRADQIFNWLYKNNVQQFSEMGNLPTGIIELLEEEFVINSLVCKDQQFAEDGTIKYLWQLTDGQKIESVFLPYEQSGRNSVCVSSQVGCELGCEFCLTGKQGWQRNLSVAEIVDQVLKIQKLQTEQATDSEKQVKINNIVFMGMGEPLLNLPAVLTAISIFNNDRGLNIGQRRITVSTAGIIPGIKKLTALKMQVGLAVSLNAPTDRIRNQIMPVNKKYSLDNLLQVVKKYIEVTGRRVTFEYVLIKNVNDSPVQAQKTAELLQDLMCHVNLIPLNTSSRLPWQPPGEKRIRSFKNELENCGINVTLRASKGDDIQAACGQLKGSR